MSHPSAPAIKLINDCRQEVLRVLFAIRYTTRDFDDGVETTRLWHTHYVLEVEEEDAYGPAPVCWNGSSALKDDMSRLTDGGVDPDSLVASKVYSNPRPSYPDDPLKPTHIGCNFFNTAQGVIFCSHNDKFNDVYCGERWKLQSSEVIWQQWLHHCKESGTRSWKLHWIWRASIENATTMKVLDILAPQSGGTQTFRYDVEGEKTSFEALLGTPNGKGVAYLVRDHRQSLLGKRLRSCTVHWPDGKAMLLFELA